MRLGVAHTPSPDVRFGILPPLSRCWLRYGILPALASNAGSGALAAPHGYIKENVTTSLGPAGRVSTSGRRPAKRKWQDAMFRVKPARSRPQDDLDLFARLIPPAAGGQRHQAGRAGQAQQIG